MRSKWCKSLLDDLCKTLLTSNEVTELGIMSALGYLTLATGLFIFLALH